MKAKGCIVGILLIALLFVGVGYERGLADAREEVMPAKIAVAGIDKIIQASTKHVQWQKEMGEQEQKIRAELEKLSRELDAIKADMNTRKVGSADYLKLAREGMEKKAVLEAKEDFYEQEINIKAQQWTEQLYKEIIAAIDKVAKEKGLDIWR